MDPISQGVLGAAAALLVSNKKNRTHAAKVGCIAGLVPDLDIFIKSSTDPLLGLEFHRQFTHSILFIPFGAFIIALLLWLIVYRKTPFKQTYLFALLGYATHGLLDAFTAYGTQLLWPFSHQRIAWDFVGIVDPMVTIPLIIAVITTCITKHKKWVLAGSVFFVCYLSFGALQHHRAMEATRQIANSNSQKISRIRAMPTIGNLLVWRTLYQSGETYYVNAIRVSLTGKIKVYQGDSIHALNITQSFSTLDKNSVQYKDIQRFKWFSDDWIALDKTRPNFIADLRYSLQTNGIKPMWGIIVNPETPDNHVIYQSTKDREARNVFPWDMILGK